MTIQHFAALLGLLALSASLSAQKGKEPKVELKDDIILADKAPYAKLVKEGKWGNTTYTLKNLQDKELIFISILPQDFGDKTYVKLHFMQGDEEVFDEYGLGYAKAFAKEVVRYKLVGTDGEINPEGKKKFLIAYSRIIPMGLSGNVLHGASTNVASSSPAATYQGPERNRNASIYVFGDEIKQDFKVLGTIKDKSEAAKGGTLHTYSAYSPTGILLAEGTVQGIGSKSMSVTTFKDNRQQQISVEGIGSKDAKESLAKFLSNSGYW